MLVLTTPNYFRAYQYVYSLWAVFSMDVPWYLCIFNLIHNFINQSFSTMSSHSWQCSSQYWSLVHSASIPPHCEKWSLCSSFLLLIFLSVTNSRNLLFCIMVNWLMRHVILRILLKYKYRICYSPVIQYYLVTLWICLKYWSGFQLHVSLLSRVLWWSTASLE